MMRGLIDLLFGEQRNVIRDTVEVFRPNAEAQAGREHTFSQAALAQFTAEFATQPKGRFDRFIDGLNRLPRPALAFGTLGLFISAMVDPIWFAARMQGIALVPEPLWWLMGAIVSFYFGARHQAKGQDFRRSVASSMLDTREVSRNIRELRALDAESGAKEGIPPDRSAKETGVGGDNPALSDWRRKDAG